jgi:serine/threonine-protein kinase
MSILEAGDPFGGYQLLALLSRGGMGEVWRALKLGPSGSEWSRQVALKVILPGLADSSRFTDMFISEARIAAGLVHANIVGVTDFGREGQVLWLEQELVEGEDLGRLVERATGGFPSPMALFVTIEALKGLAYAHSHRVIHRDIKPANVLVAREGHIKLTDFGISKISSATNPSQTELKGTIGYLAPELLENQAPTVRSDLFAVGLVLWELLTGRKLFGGDNEAAKLMKTFECVVPRLAELGIWVPDPIEGILRRLLARDPAARHASSEEVLAALLEAPGGRGVTSVDLKAYLGSLGMASLPPIDGAPPRKARTGTVAGQVTVSLPGRINRFFGSRKVLGSLVVLAAASVTAAVTVHPRQAAAPAPAVVATPDARPAAVRVEVPPPDPGMPLAAAPAAPAPPDAAIENHSSPTSDSNSAPPAPKPPGTKKEAKEMKGKPSRGERPATSATPPIPKPGVGGKDDVLSPGDDP